jgi:tetratricopeptide (TPR) repeat protein
VSPRALPLLVSILALTTAFTAGYIGNEDFWWYLASGELILERGEIPSEDPFLYTSDLQATWVTSGQVQRTWITHSWLWTVVLAVLDRHFGLDGVAIFSALCVGALTALCFGRARLDRFGLVNGALTALALAGAIGRFTPRTDLVSCLLLVVFLVVLDRERPLRWPTLFGLAALQWLWSNLHGGYLLGLGVAFAVGLGDWLQGRLAGPGRGPRGEAGAQSAAPLLALGPLLCLASIATPTLGPERLRAALAFVGELGATTAGATANPLLEWQPTYAAGLDASARLHLALCAVGVAGFAAARPPRRLSRLLIFAGTALLGAAANRFVSVFALVTALVTLANLGSLHPALARRLQALRRPWQGVAAGLAAGLCCALLWTTAASLWIAREALDGGAARRGFVATRAEFAAPGAAAYIRAHSLPAPIFNEIVLHALFPDYQLFIDTRNLSAPVLTRYRAAVAGQADWQSLLERRGFRTVVLSNLSFASLPLRRLLARDPGWRLVFLDPQAAVFVRSDAAQPEPELSPNGRWGAGRAPFLPPDLPPHVARQYGMSLLLEYLRALAELEQPEALERVAGDALAALPHDPALLGFRGFARLRLERPEEAAEDFREQVSRTPDDVVARFNLARALARSGRLEEARAEIDEASRRDPNHPALERVRQQIERMRPRAR